MTSKTQKSVVFCSYAREDKDFVQRLRAELARHDVELSGDWNVETLVPYLEQLHGAIDSADAFLFVISSRSVLSAPCGEELEYAVKSNKRLAPIVREDVDDALVNSHLRSIQYVFLREGDDFQGAVNTLVRSITSDLEWVKMHTYVLERALDWERKLRPAASLLRGGDLDVAERWVATAGADATKEPRPTELQASYITASRQEHLREERELADLMTARLTAETAARSEAERRAAEQELFSRRLLRRATLLGIALCIAIAAAVLAFYQLNVAEARRTAAIALSIMATGYDRALLLSAQAYASHRDSETVGSLMTAMQRNGGLRRFLRHNAGTTWKLAVNADGTMFASGHGDGSVLLWDARNDQPVGPPLTAHTKAVKAVAFSHDGTLLASASEDKTVVLWDVKSRKPLAVLTGHDKQVEDVAFSPDGRILASAGQDNMVRLWDVGKRQPLAEPLVGHSAAVWCLQFSPDGTILASGSDDDTIILWNLKTHEQLESLTEHTDSVRELSFSPDGSMLASGGDDKVIILWDVPSRKSLGAYLEGHTNSVSGVAFSPDGRFLASSSSDTTVRLWNISTHELETTFSGHAVAINTVAFSADGKHLVSGGWDNNILLWDVDKPHRLRDTIAETADSVNVIDVAADGTLLGGDRAGRIIVKQASSAHVRNLLSEDVRASRRSLAASADGKFLASGNGDGTITLWDITAAAPTVTLLQGHTRAVTAVAFSPDSKTLISGSNDGTVRVWDVLGRKTKTPPLRRHTGAVYGVAFSPDGGSFASCGDDQSVVLWNASTLEPKGNRFIDHADAVSEVAFTLDGKSVISGSSDNRVSSWDLASHKVRTLNPREDFSFTTMALAFSPDGKRLAFVNRNNHVMLVDPAMPAASHSMLSFPGLEISSLAFSRDGRVLAIAGSRKDILLWDIAAGKRLGVLTGHDGRVNGLVFGSDGATLISSSADGTVRSWNWRDQKMLKVFGDASFVRSTAFAPNGPLVALGFDDGRVVLSNRNGEKQPLRNLPGHKETVFKVAFSPTGKLLASASKDHTVRIWDPIAGSQVGLLAAHTDSVTVLAFSPSGRILASGGDDNSIVLWDTASLKAIGQPLREHQNNITSLAFSPDGALLASGSRDRTIILWDMKRTPPIPIGQRLRGHNAPVFALAFSRDGKTLASGGFHTLFLWNLAAGEPLGPFLTPPDEVHALMFSADGKTLYSAGDKLFSWSIDPDAWLALARATANRESPDTTIPVSQPPAKAAPF